MAQVYNHDVIGVVRRLYRVMVEMHKSQSHGKAGMSSFDQDRLSQYIAEVRSQLEWIQAQPDLDLPESHPEAFDLEDVPNLSRVENEAINDIVRLCRLTCIELINCASARDSARLNKYDYSRCANAITKVESYLKTHVAVVTPSDWPESSPRAEMAGKGLLGV